jgi:hypothetical protein
MQLVRGNNQGRIGSAIGFDMPWSLLVEEYHLNGLNAEVCVVTVGQIPVKGHA